MGEETNQVPNVSKLVHEILFDSAPYLCVTKVIKTYKRWTT